MIRNSQLRFAARGSALQLDTASLRALLTAFAALVLVTGCGTPGAPSAPSLKLPNPATDLAAVRSGDEVQLKWTMPKRSTDKLVLTGRQRTVILRTLQSGVTQTVAELLFDPAIATSFTDKLPPDLVSGPLRQLTYVVKFENHALQSAGGSNAAYAAAGAALAPLTGLTATTEPRGVLLHWIAVPGEQAESATEPLIRIHRRLVAPAPTPTPKKDGMLKQESNNVDEQVLILRPPANPSNPPSLGSALDTSALFDRKYRYVAERVLVATFGTRSVEVAGLASSPVDVDTRDVFPPESPVGLAAIAVPDQNAIDLSWTTNMEPDLAGYAVYRREAQGAWARISPEALVLAPEFRDIAIAHSHSYSYAVTAIDHNGNESERSTMVEETLP